MRDAHLGIQVEDLDRACTLLNRLFGLTFAEPITGWPIHVQLGEGGEVEHSEGRFTVSRQGPPYVEVTENVEGSRVWQSDGRPMAFHHAAAGYPVEAGGLDDQGRYRYTYHDVDGLRVEMAGASARPAFERWARTGVAEGASEEFQRGRADAPSSSHDLESEAAR